LSRSKKVSPKAQTTPSPWRATPPLTRTVFLLAVFFTFAGIGFATDVANLGHDPVKRLAVQVAITATFAVFYAVAGVTLRGRFMRAIAVAPIFAVQMLCTVAVRRLIPGPPEGAAANLAASSGRLSFDGLAIMASVALGYAGLITVSIRESRRYAKSQVEKTRLESEMAAAREVQRVMVPQELPAVPGYSIDSVYQPAAEVGGDFFQLIPLPSGNALAVIGDVSGKGLSAAMIVSMIVGMLGAVAGFTEEPAEILAELNRRLHGRMHGGFATCLAVRLGAGGNLALATAGHPSPYLNGREVPLAGSLPLGMSEPQSFAQTTLDLRVSDRVVLLTDGIPEARDEDGVLFGFPRIESLLRDGASAKALADAAQQHGQNDDITVIAISRTA
jgi:hypothetical protein